MEKFLKPFTGRDVFCSVENIIDKDDGAEINYIKCLRKIIFRQDVTIELKRVLSLACSSEAFTVKNDIIKKTIAHLNLFLLSDEDIKAKTDVFLYVFETFVSLCKDDNITLMQFFVVLSHILGMNEMPLNNETTEMNGCNSIINSEYFNRAFEVDISNPSLMTFSIFKELLLSLSKLSFNFNLPEIQPYRKWLHQLIKNIAFFQPFQNVFLAIFSVCAEIDLRLLEGNLNYIFCSIFALTPPWDDDFYSLYSSFFEKALDICSKFQRTIKFVEKFLSSIKATSTVLVRETILPLNVISKFSKIVSISSNQQSISLLDLLMQNLDECYVNISQKNSRPNSSLVFAISDLLICYFKNVRLYAPGISSTTLLVLIDKINAFKESLRKFGTYLFKNTSFMLKNEDIVKNFLNLCVYCCEIELLIDCYKDSFLRPSDIMTPETEYEWHCCLSLDQWQNLISIVLKSNLETLSPTCFRLALQKCRQLKLANNMSSIDESTMKIIMSQLKSGLKEFNIFQQLPPEDFIIVMDVLSAEQSKSVCKKIFKELMESSTKEESTAWLSNSVLQENAVFVFGLFSRIWEETGCVLRSLFPDNSYSKISWLSDVHFDKALQASLEGLPEKMNALLKAGEKLRKHLRKKGQQKELIVRISEVFKLLPLPYVEVDYRRLGLCFALSMGVLLSEDENSVCLPFESMCGFLTSDVDASTCFDVGLCVNWLLQVYYENKKTDDLRMRLIEILIRNAPNTKFGLIQLGEMIDSIAKEKKHTDQLKMLESRVVLYNDLGKCWQRAKKRKSDNDLIGSYRSKLAKIISEGSKQLEEDTINSENSKLLLKVFTIELNKAIKKNEEKEISVLMEEKFLSHFDFAVKSLKRNFNEPSVSFLTVLLQCVPQVRKFLPEGSIIRIWKALKFYEKVNWRFFCNHTSDEEFSEILADLLNMSKKFLKSETGKYSSYCFEIWVSFFESGSESKRHCCQLRLQDFFHYVPNCSLLLRELPIRKKIVLVKFASFCVSGEEVVLTSHMLDTIIHLMIECLEDASSVDDFYSLFTVEMETASAMFLRQFEWSKSKVHLIFVIFKKMLTSLMKRCDASLEPSKDDIIKLSKCAFCTEKWVSLLVKSEKDFARTTPYFITVLISSVASVTVLPAIKIHLVNCINYFLSISDSYTVSYLMRVLRPGYQQVFNSMYGQFKQYHKYSGKI